VSGDDIVERLRSEHRMALAPIHMSDAADEIKRLLAEVRGFQAESGCWQRWHDAERALADQLASELKDATEYADWPDFDHLKRAREVLAAHAAARTNGSAGATDVGAQP
jgi:hypothetical protein